MKIEVRYFALLREWRGVEAEWVETTAENSGELYEELAARHGFRLPKSAVRVALNGEFAAMGQALGEGDRVAFLPPVAGG